ncbi:MAG: hypothetical protein RR645_08175, partial [Clostridium sp.]
MDYRRYKRRIKRGVTYIEVLASLFIIMTIIIIVSPYVVSTKKNEIIRVTNSIVTELKVIKTLAISKN